MTLEDMDAIAVTYGPGLVGALLVGVATAKAIAFAAKKPLIGVNHIEGHIAANYIENHDFEPPFICLIVSGGHTHLVYVKDYGLYEIIGKQETMLQGKLMIKLQEPLELVIRGPKIDELALEGDPYAIEFPRAYLEDGSFDFSFSGLKSAVLNYLNRSKMMGEAVNINNVAASFQQAVIEVLVTKTIDCAKQKRVNKIALAGGVSANRGLRQLMKKNVKKKRFFFNIHPLNCVQIMLR